jgi:WD40 repeat protein
VCGGRLFSFSLGRRDGRNLLAAECIDESVELWDITDLRAPHRMRESLPNEPAGDSVESVAFSPSGNMMAVAAVPSSDDYAIIQLWSVAASGVPKLFWSTVIHNSDLPAVTFSDQGETLAASDDGTGAVDVWDIAGNSVAAGRSFLSPSDSFEDNPSPVTFVPGSPLLVNANAANGMDVWNTAGSSTQRPTEELSGGTGIVTDLSTSPDGHWLVSADQDGTIRLWDQVQPDKFALYGNPLNPDSAWELDTAFSPVSDGTFATLDNTGAVYLWDLDPGSAINRICADTANILTPSVWSQTLPGVPYQPPCG